MDSTILNLEQAADFLGVGEKTLIKLLREEHIPARKIGREWRFSKEALVNWLAKGDSMNYTNNNVFYGINKDISATSDILFNDIVEALSVIKRQGNNIKAVFSNLDRDIILPNNAVLRVAYKQNREIEKLEFKIYWAMRENCKLETNQKVKLSN